ncbi:hypothetical protein Bpfe_006113 [Biomphalaria pfeifferi]|uniref:Uncharacterized protein n=1 Tax=Biomphalaria pfeifferi TaxID=112525 RepID=A0AAD8C0V4_BIOPF|nr:hypothetical protein Bpfe_006113 [Biomphalaria pfeifferi]
MTPFKAMADQSPFDEVDRIAVNQSQNPEDDTLLNISVNRKSEARCFSPIPLYNLGANPLEVKIKIEPIYDAIAVHPDIDIQQNRVQELRGTVDHIALWNKNERLYKLAHVRGTKYSKMIFIDKSKLVTEQNVRNTSIYLFPDTTKSITLDVNSLECLNDGSNVLVCHNVPIEIFPLLQQFNNNKLAIKQNSKQNNGFCVF